MIGIELLKNCQQDKLVSVLSTDNGNAFTPNCNSNVDEDLSGSEEMKLAMVKRIMGRITIIQGEMLYHGILRTF